MVDYEPVKIFNLSDDIGKAIVKAAVKALSSQAEAIALSLHDDDEGADISQIATTARLIEDGSLMKEVSEEDSLMILRDLIESISFTQDKIIVTFRTEEAHH